MGRRIVLHTLGAEWRETYIVCVIRLAVGAGIGLWGVIMRTSQRTLVGWLA
jgi:hypothetical protein